nr:4'-phosphopantetheinyl transferase superfamily protein [Gelidibacter gilvus]
MSEHTGLTINKIILDTDGNKKPYLPSHPSVYFNVTHSGNFAIISVGKSPVGIDIEFINREFNYEEILPSIFNQNEIDGIQKNSDKHLSFYNFWTRKEAIVKAIGKGIDDDIVKIPVQDGYHTVSPSLIGGYNKINVFSFRLNEDYVGAFAVTENLYNFEKIIFSPIPTEKELKSSFHK